MINDLTLAISMNQRLHVREFVVSRDVFQQVMNERYLDGETGMLAVNLPYDSPRYRYLNRVAWRGIVFIHISNSAFSTDPAWIGMGT